MFRIYSYCFCQNYPIKIFLTFAILLNTTKMKHTELITNTDGSIFHLHLLPEDIADNIIIVGDPDRVEMIGEMLENIRIRKNNREFHTITGNYGNLEVTVISSGIGTDNIDIVLNELDALANINLATGEIKEDLRSLNFVRIGTSGALQEDMPVGSVAVSAKAIGFDGLLHFYQGYDWCIDTGFADALAEHLEWPDTLAYPYVIDADPDLLEKFPATDFLRGNTISAPGFYGPQGRSLRLEPFDTEINDKITSFRYMGLKVTNYEMESSAIYGLSKLLNHKAITLCIIIANRVTGDFLNDYKPAIRDLVKKVLETL
jgi:uridine phosphorylase